MNLFQSRIVRAGLLFVGLLVVFSLLYLPLKPQYDKTIQRCANLVTRQLAPPTWVDNTHDGRWRCHQSAPDYPDRVIYHWNLVLPDLVYLSLALVPALTLATPTTWRNRLRITGVGIVLVFVSHVAVMIGLMRAAVCTIYTPQNFVCFGLLRLFYVSGQLFGAAIWVLLSWRYWFRPARSGAGG